MENSTYQEYPLISVIIPVYKVEKYICRCVDSVVGQTYSNLDIILVNDGSPDNCGKICDRYTEKDDRIRVIHKENGGLSDARNAGIEVAKGKYIGFVDSDDYIAPDMYEVLMKEIKEHHADISICGYYSVKNKAIPSYSQLETQILNASDGLREIIYSSKYGMMAWSKLYKAELFCSLRYPKGHVYEDVYVIADIFEHVKVAAFNSRPLYYYVHRPGSITTDVSKESTLDLISSHEHLHEKIYQCFPELKHIADVRLFWGYISVLNRSVLTEEKELNKQIQSYIRKNIVCVFDSFFTIKRRLMAVTACVSLRLYKWCIMILKKQYTESCLAQKERM